jgi:hypothetical protein
MTCLISYCKEALVALVQVMLLCILCYTLLYGFHFLFRYFGSGNLSTSCLVDVVTAVGPFMT